MSYMGFGVTISAADAPRVDLKDGLSRDCEVKSFRRGIVTDEIGRPVGDQAEFDFLVTDCEGNTATVHENLRLAENLLWKHRMLLKACGVVPADATDDIVLSLELYQSLVGRHFRCEIGHHDWVSKRDGKTRTSVSIKRFLYGDEA